MKPGTKTIQIKFRVTPEQRDLIEAKMARLGIHSREAYLRKMAIDGYAVTLNIPELREVSSRLYRAGNNLNQIARRMNETGRIYHEDLNELRQEWETCSNLLRQIMDRLSNLAGSV